MKITLTVFFLLLYTADSISQSRLQTGLTIGYNSSTFLGDDKPGEKLDPIPGLYLGGIIHYPLNERFSLVSNVALCLRGTKINTFNEISEPVLFVYLDIPLMARMNFLPGRIITPYAELGGAFDVNILSIGLSGPYYDVRKFDFGMVSGVGIRLGKISLEMRYHLGLTHFDRSELESDLRHSTLSFLLGLTFGK
jgi:hypothetical protein